MATAKDATTTQVIFFDDMLENVAAVVGLRPPAGVAIEAHHADDMRARVICSPMAMAYFPGSGRTQCALSPRWPRSGANAVPTTTLLYARRCTLVCQPLADCVAQQAVFDFDLTLSDVHSGGTALLVVPDGSGSSFRVLC